jgi:NAD(P)-dependent dehydrogenase (short-subunit alcohol dehydrogenase family)
MAWGPRYGSNRRPKRRSQPGDVAAQAAAGAVTGRFTRPEEVADLALLLASDRTDNVTGSDFSIDGGLVQTL